MFIFIFKPLTLFFFCSCAAQVESSHTVVSVLWSVRSSLLTSCEQGLRWFCPVFTLGNASIHSQPVFPDCSSGHFSSAPVAVFGCFPFYALTNPALLKVHLIYFELETFLCVLFCFSLKESVQAKHLEIN